MAAPKTSEGKEVIRKSARQMFRERGYAATSMRDIARAAGMEAPSIYSHFASKEKILHEICFGMAQVFFEAIDEVMKSDSAASEKLRAAILSHAQVIHQHTEESNVFFHEWIFLSGPDLMAFKKLRSNYEKNFRLIIEQGIREGLFKNVNVRLATFTILSSLNGIYELNSNQDKLNVAEIGNTIADLILNGIQKP